jgi:hypothetical protein
MVLACYSRLAKIGFGLCTTNNFFAQEKYEFRFRQNSAVEIPPKQTFNLGDIWVGRKKKNALLALQVKELARKGGKCTSS